MFMNTEMEKYRIKLKACFDESGRSVLSVAREYDVPQASLWRFLNGEQGGLNARTVFKLEPFITNAKPNATPHPLP